MPRSLPRAAASLRRASNSPQSEVLDRLREATDRVAAVVFRRRRLVRVGLFRNEIPLANLHPVDAGLARRLLDQPLRKVDHARSRGAAIRGGRRGVGHRESVSAVQHRNAVGVRRVQACHGRVDHRPRLRQICAEVDEPIEPQSEESPFLVECELADKLHAAAVMVAHERLGTRADPLDRSLHGPRRQHQRRILRIGVDTDSEPASDVELMHADLLRRKARHRDETGAQHLRALPARVDVVGVGRLVVRRQATLGLHRVAYHALRIELDPRHVGGARKRVVGLRRVAVLPVEHEVTGHVFVDLRRTGRECRVDLDDRGELAVFHLDQLDRILGRQHSLRNDERDFLPDVAHASARKHVAMRHLERHAFPPGKLYRRRWRAKARFRRILASEHREDAGMREGRRDVDRNDLGVCVVRAQKARVALALQIDISRVAPRAGEQAPVLAPPLESSAHAPPPKIVSPDCRWYGASPQPRVVSRRSAAHP